jgi:error-prone DNA polymerase
VENLIAVGALDCFGRPRRELLWEAGTMGRWDTGARGRGETLDLAATPPPPLPPLTPYEETAAEYSLLGLSPGRHAVELFRDFLEERNAVPCGRLGKLPRNLIVQVGGLVVCEQAPPTAKGHVFLTLEDETGLANVILRPGVYQRFRRVLHTNQIVLVEGLLMQQDSITNLMARKVLSLPEAALLGTGNSKRPHRR